MKTNLLKIISICILTPMFVQAKDIMISIKNAGELTAVGSATYQATRNSALCKEFTLNEGSGGFVLKRRYDQFPAQDGLVTIPQSIKSYCKFERIDDGTLSFEVEDVKEAYKSIYISVGGGTTQDQVVECSEIISGPKNNQPMINCSGDIKTTEDGKASVMVNFKK